MKKEKMSKEEVIKRAMSIMPDITDQSFHSFTSNDDAGIHLVNAIELDENGKLNMNGRIPSNFFGWRSVMLIVPNGYIDTFYKNKKEGGEKQ